MTAAWCRARYAGSTTRARAPALPSLRALLLAAPTPTSARPRRGGASVCSSSTAAGVRRRRRGRSALEHLKNGDHLVTRRLGRPRHRRVARVALDASSARCPRRRGSRTGRAWSSSAQEVRSGDAASLTPCTPAASAPTRRSAARVQDLQRGRLRGACSSPATAVGARWRRCGAARTRSTARVSAAASVEYTFGACRCGVHLPTVPHVEQRRGRLTAEDDAARAPLRSVNSHPATTRMSSAAHRYGDDGIVSPSTTRIQSENISRVASG